MKRKIMLGLALVLGGVGALGAATPKEIAAWQKTFPSPSPDETKAAGELAKDLKWWASQATPDNAPRTLRIMRERAEVAAAHDAEVIKSTRGSRATAAARNAASTRAEWLRQKLFPWLDRAPQ